jgi:hypothetical protein
MRLSTLMRLGAALAALAASAGAASAACTRAVYNNSPYLLTFSQNGGPGMTVRPGGRVPIHLDRGGGRIALAAYCPGPYGAELSGSPVAQETFEYVADPGICFMKWAFNGLTPYANRIDVENGTRPFVVNNPHQGDVILGPFGPACPQAIDQALVRKY